MTNQPKNLGVRFQKDGSFIRLSGFIDEFAEFGPLLAMNPPLRLLMGDIRSINSHGIRRWIRFIHDYGLKSIEFHECPPVFIDAANMIGDVVSTNDNMKRIKSFITPYACESCGKNFRLVVPAEALIVKDKQCDVVSQFCPRCGQQLQIGVDPDDYFVFAVA